MTLNGSGVRHISRVLHVGISNQELKKKPFNSKRYESPDIESARRSRLKPDEEPGLKSAMSLTLGALGLKPQIHNITWSRIAMTNNLLESAKTDARSRKDLNRQPLIMTAQFHSNFVLSTNNSADADLIGASRLKQQYRRNNCQYMQSQGENDQKHFCRISDKTRFNGWRKAGFEDISCHWRYLNFVFSGGQKAQQLIHWYQGSK